MARPALQNIIFTDEEKTIILSAIFHHGDKAHVHDEYDEVDMKRRNIYETSQKSNIQGLFEAFLIYNSN